MFADFRVHGLNTTFFQFFHQRGPHLLTGKEKGRASPGFPVEFGGVGELHAAFLTESRTRGHVRCSVKEVRVAPLFQPMYAKVREHGAPVQGARLVRKQEICRTTKVNPEEAKGPAVLSMGDKSWVPHSSPVLA
jgi:hypothetical protein